MLRTLGVLSIAIASACTVADEQLPAGKLARVGERVFGPEDLAAVGSQLGAYGQLRFRGDEGRSALLESLVVAEIMAQEAEAAGLGNDPRVEFALLEEIAAVTLSAELERRVPRQAIVDDREALFAYYEAHPEAFTIGERRSARGVVFVDLGRADDALEAVRMGAARLEEFGEVLQTPLQTRDDHEFPGLHPILFDPDLQPGDLLPIPVMLGDQLLVGVLDEIAEPELEPFEDERVQERLVEAVRAPKLAAAKAELLAELRERYPASPP